MTKPTKSIKSINSDYPEWRGTAGFGKDLMDKRYEEEETPIYPHSPPSTDQPDLAPPAHAQGSDLMDLMDKTPPVGGWRHYFAALNRRRADELRTEARRLTGRALRGAMRDAVWHMQEARRHEWRHVD